MDLIEFKKFINQINTYDEFETKLKQINNNKIKGDYFELFCKYYFKLLEVNRIQYTDYKMLNELTEIEKNELNLPLTDKGIDGILYDNNKIYAIQVKFTSNNNKILNFGKLATFPALTFGCNTNFNKAILFTNSVDMCDELKNDNRYILINNFKKCNTQFWSNIRNSLNTKELIYEPFKPLKHQNELIETIEEYYKKENRGRLYMPCGTGKTFMGYWISTQICKAEKIFIVVPSLYLLSETFETWVKQTLNDNFEYLLLGSDIDRNNKNFEYLLTTDKNEAKNKLLNKKKILVITTYQSSHILKKICEDVNFIFDFGIFDEAHRTVGEKNKMYTSLISNKFYSKKTIFMTATEKIYNYTKSKLDEKRIENIISMNNEKIYGKVILNYSMKKAIESNQLCDYKIIAPRISNYESEKIIDSDKNISINNINTNIKTLSLSSTIKNTFDNLNNTHMLVFTNKNKKAHEIYELLKYLYNDTNDIYIKYLNGSSSMNKRRCEIQKFKDSKRAIICSARIFGEGVNIPICDSICFAENKSSSIDIVQYLGRCLRLCKEKPNKLSNVIIPFYLNKDNNIFTEKSTLYYKLRTILKSIGTTDDTVIDKFNIVDYSNINKLKDHDEQADIINQNINFEDNDLLKLQENIKIMIFDKEGTPENTFKKFLNNYNFILFNENKKLYDTKNECNKLLIKDNWKNIKPNPKNWVKYCLGDKLFNIIKKKYYYSVDDLKKVCKQLKINSFDDYENKRKFAPKLPSSKYINNGFYSDLENYSQFNDYFYSNDEYL